MKKRARIKVATLEGSTIVVAKKISPYWGMHPTIEKGRKKRFGLVITHIPTGKSLFSIPRKRRFHVKEVKHLVLQCFPNPLARKIAQIEKGDGIKNFPVEIMHAYDSFRSKIEKTLFDFEM